MNRRRGHLGFWFWLALVNFAFIAFGHDSVQVTVAFWACLILNEVERIGKRA
jgi:hypothetical protein